MLIFVVMINLPVQTVATGWVAVAFVIIYNFFFGFGWAAVPWLYGIEVSMSSTQRRSQAHQLQLAPLTYRHVGGAACAFGEWLGSFITVFAGGIALNQIGPKIWIWQVLSCALTVVVVYFMCPEVYLHLSIPIYSKVGLEMTVITDGWQNLGRD
jgi:hypothetical protein